ncbi:hypothetical protein V2J09_017663 [Rumex salicifolius]
MNRSAAKRLFPDARRLFNSQSQCRFSHVRSFVTSKCFTTSPADNQSSRSQNPNFNEHHPSGPESVNDMPGAQTSTDPQGSNIYEEEQARVLRASLPHVNRLGWTEAAMMAGARDAGISPAIVGSFSRKDAALVEYFMDDCLQKLIDKIDADESLKNLIPSECISKLLKIRLEMQIPYIARWAQALSIQAMPNNIPTSFKMRAMLIDEIWHAAGDTASDVDWYMKRTVLGGIYSSTEVYMLADNSQDFQDTWAFMDARVRDAMDLRKVMQEAKHFAEVVGAGMSTPLQGLAKRVFQGQ